MYKPSDFQKLKIQQKYTCIKKNSVYVASRIFESYQVYLYSYNNYYVELWCRVGLSQICWIEVVYNKDSLQSYVEDFNVIKELGLDE